METVYRILRYLINALRKGILFSNKGHFNIEGFTNANCVGSPDDRWSTSGYYTFVGENLAKWRYKK